MVQLSGDLVPQAHAAQGRLHDRVELGAGGTSVLPRPVGHVVVDGERERVGSLEDHAHDGNLVVSELGESGRIGDLRLGKDVGVADLHGTLGDLRDALAGATALDGDLNVGVLGHER